MASHIKLNQSGLESSKSRVIQAKESYDTAISTLKNVINSLQEVWEGEAQTAMYQRYQEKEKTFQRFSEEIGDYIAGMDKTLKELPGNDAEVAAAINKLNFG